MCVLFIYIFVVFVCVCVCRSCSNHHPNSSCLAKENEVCKNNGMQGNSGHSAAVGEGSRKYCLCSYCELFGHNGVRLGRVGKKVGGGGGRERERVVVRKNNG